MSRKQDRINISTRIKSAAISYRQHLVGHKFMYVFDNRYIEVIFKADNFRHLTGVDTNLSAKQFYKYDVKGKLEASQIRFSSIHPYDLCTRKIRHLNDIATMAGSECFMLEEIRTDTMTYKFGTTDLKFTLCLNRETDLNGIEKSECYVVQSLRDEDCFSKSAGAYDVTHIFSKKNDEKTYTRLLYMDRSSNMDLLPPEIHKMLDEALFSTNSLTATSSTPGDSDSVAFPAILHTHS